MNVVQLMRRARQGIDAILPGGTASGHWSDEEAQDAVNEAYEQALREFRLVHKKWGLVTLNTSSTAFTRDGETYTPSTALVLSSTTNKLTLPPDFAELIRITCTNNRAVRFVHAQEETYHWIDAEQSGFSDQSLPLQADPNGLVFYWDIIGERTLILIPPVNGSFNLEIDYIPMFQPLTYSLAGTVGITQGLKVLTGTTTTWVTDNVYTEDQSQRAELIPSINSVTSASISTNARYARVAAITSDTAATMVSNWGPATLAAATHILAMAPIIPREYHRWLSRIAGAIMLTKVSPDIAEKYEARTIKQLREQINSTIRRRQSQDSVVTEDAEEMGVGSDY